MSKKKKLIKIGTPNPAVAMDWLREAYAKMEKEKKDEAFDHFIATGEVKPLSLVELNQKFLEKIHKPTYDFLSKEQKKKLGLKK